MSKRITTYEGVKYQATIRYYSDVEEYKVTLFSNENSDVISTYYTDCIDDAHRTASKMVELADKAIDLTITSLCHNS